MGITRLRPTARLMVAVTSVNFGTESRQGEKDGSTKRVPVLLRIDTPIKVDYYKHSGILPFVLRSLLAA
ncbi:hypothetical protein [Paraburkholderia sp.]|uniref:hypothetical protein n=1 Tax=Paraburkholderia sp. TaxID=1926495 RepID=UPI003D6DDF34